jgi:hypothetical protein
VSIETNPHPTGWLHDPGEVQGVLTTMPMPLFGVAAPHLWRSGANQTTLLYKAWKDVNGSYVDYPAQEIGCCVSRGFGHGVDLLQCVQVSLGKKAEKFTPTSHEFIYGTCRVDIGGQRGSYQDGAVGAWAAKAVSTIGTVSQELVGPYDDRKCKEWGARGVPANLKQEAAEHQVLTTSLVTTYEELEDALANGFPVTVCSGQGFTMTRDQDGFCQPRGSWQHCMLICAVRSESRPGACIFQSWGSSVPSGPLALDQPPNSFWADKQVVARMLGMQDSWALSAYEGYPGTPLPSAWTYGGFI